MCSCVPSTSLAESLCAGRICVLHTHFNDCANAQWSHERIRIHHMLLHVCVLAQALHGFRVRAGGLRQTRQQLPLTLCMLCLLCGELVLQPLHVPLKGCIGVVQGSLRSTLPGKFAGHCSGE